eukprot:CAMPEP_0198333490 /NCGR_PEP_ID=MMETSP1450-20131203/18983_1 /TAXON_ID=753684 ORGANISM="Madagascaria erythrocladiodes, Strain CCMP3234" /NCGR_SAMPLE_ID=MMETSP1450 /ASSEMBLY_ACC=CAM_ASM_001115 /LENGTH=148 /DNA_ID=CAMNT_0044038015 /DNA_START=496 /DNA_END=942 /DNA_ORIENTATION=+
MNDVDSSIGLKTIASEDRFGLVVYYPAGSGIQARHMFFSRRASVGRVLDIVEEKTPELGRINQGQRLFLYSAKVGKSVQQLPHMAILSEMDERLLARGDAVIVETHDVLPPVWSTAFGPSASAKPLLDRSKVSGKKPKSSLKTGCKVQ